MIRIASFDDIEILIEFRIRLMKESSNGITDYDWDKYSEILGKYYYEGLSNGEVLACLSENNKDIVATCVMCF